MSLDLEKLQDSPHLLDILIQMEDVLDNLDVYVFRNWIKGEVVEGPVIGRHWLSMSLLYPERQMPDPRAALRLLKHDITVAFSKVQRAPSHAGSTQADPTQAEASAAPGDKESAPETHWMVKISYPRRLINQIENIDLKMYGDEVEMDDVEDAKDSGLNQETAYTDQGDEAQQDMTAESDPLADPNAPPQGPANG